MPTRERFLDLDAGLVEGDAPSFEKVMEACRGIEARSNGTVPAP